MKCYASRRKRWVERLPADQAAAIIAAKSEYLSGRLHCSALSLATSIKEHIETIVSAKTIADWICDAKA